MALSFPLALAVFADLLPVRSLKWRLTPAANVSGLGSGQIYEKNVAPSLWRTEVALDAMPHAEADRIAALIEAAQAAGGGFYLYSPARRWPQADPGGAILGAATPQIHTLGGNNRSLRISGLPAGYQLTRGDFFHFDYASPARRAFHRLAETVTADGAGLTPLCEVVPHFNPGVATGATVTLIKPACLAAVWPGSFDPGESRHALTVGMAFTAVQKLR